MIAFPCPWCEDEVAPGDRAMTEPSVRCDGCGTVVDLGPAEVAVSLERALPLPLAA